MSDYDDQVGRWCPHKNIVIDKEARRVTCRKCEQEIDAFNALLNLADNIERYTSLLGRMFLESARARLANVQCAPVDQPKP